MKAHARFVKTDKGQDEIRNRTCRLQPKPRALLVIVDGKKAADELLQTATSMGGGPSLLETLLEEGYIEEVAAAAAVPAAEESREKVYAAKAAMRRYIKVAAVDVRLLNNLVDGVRTSGDVVQALREMQLRFESNGFSEAFANLRKELSE
jgi:hypothetical protein